MTVDTKELMRQLRAEEAVLRRRLAAIAKLIEGLTELHPDEATEAVGPRGQDAVRRALVMSPGTWMTVADLVTLLDRLGWMKAESRDPAAAVRQALKRLMATDHEIFRTHAAAGRGAYYCYRPVVERRGDEQEPQVVA